MSKEEVEMNLPPWPSLAVLVFVIAGSACSGTRDTDRLRESLVDHKSQAPREVVAYLGEPVEKIRGMQWPVYDGQLSDLAAREEPCMIRIHYGDGAVLESRSQSVFFEQEQGRLTYLKIMPLERPGPLQVVAQHMEEQLGQVKSPEAAKILGRVQEWSRSFDQSEPGMAYFVDAEISDDVLLSIELRRRLDYEGWYYTIGFSTEGPQGE